MAVVVRRFYNNSTLEYDRGKFDDWCVYYRSPSGKRYAPRDTQYFAGLKRHSKKYTPEKIYNDFCKIYDMTGKQLNPKVFDFITDISKEYKEDAYRMNVIFSILYMGMLAEENKNKSILGKKIKRLGVYNLLIKDKSPAISAESLNKRKWYDINKECKAAGF